MSETEFLNRVPFDIDRFKDLTAEWKGRVLFSPTIGSTNEEARLLLRSEMLTAPLLWLTDQQVAGRGRLGRTWQAPAFSSLLFTLAFPVQLPLNQAFLYSSALALAILQACQEQLQIILDLKWPNDLLRNGYKVAGILAELENGLGTTKNQSWLALGCGLNVSVTKEEFAVAELQDKATALLPLTDAPKAPDREQLLAGIVTHWQTYQKKVHSDPQAVQQEWSNRLLTIGKWVEVWMNEQVVAAGTASRIDPNGALVVRQANGEERSFAAADVSVRLPDGRYSA